MSDIVTLPHAFHFKFKKKRSIMALSPQLPLRHAAADAVLSEQALIFKACI
ncbi:hypothetical protein SAMN05216412_101539 [Nitrosospira multiformis]|uniref:Uncharacterized protein n=1 Tax=Nitrosospira multiformis TaxID=1231 RepID=A0A1H9Z881_9PROT|nr:hypothetical protein [Nitrosospira multiformis]SES77658.1 hypothetical protein SAMN05216412_101539 [Nitrosospira multiformis]